MQFVMARFNKGNLEYRTKNGFWSERFEDAKAFSSRHLACNAFPWDQGWNLFCIEQVQSATDIPALLQS